MNGLEKEHGHTRVGLYVQAMAKWLAVALVTGVCCGVVGSLFHIGVERATELREQHPWLLWCLPAAGLVIVAFYKLTKTEGQGTNDIIDAVHHGKPLSIWLLPAIFLGTILTHLCGGSAGREGAALQMGGTIGRHAGNLFNLDDRDLRTDTMAELNYYDRKRVHNLKYYTWVEQQGKTSEELNALWYDTEGTWDAVHQQAAELDEMINEFNEATGLLKSL